MFLRHILISVMVEDQPLFPALNLRLSIRLRLLI